MTGKLKTLILLVALVALPLRGMAAVAMMHCAEGNERGAVSQQAAHGSGHDHADHAAMESAEVADPAAHHGHEPGSQEGSTDHPSSPVATACSACAACCIGGAVAPSAWQSLSFAPIGAGRIPFAEQRFTGFVPAQPDRPPLLQRL